MYFGYDAGSNSSGQPGSAALSGRIARADCPPLRRRARCSKLGSHLRIPRASLCVRARSSMPRPIRRLMRRLGLRRLSLRSIGIGIAYIGALWAGVLIGIVFFHILLATIRGSKTKFCANCGTTDVRPSWPAGLVDRLLAVLRHYPYRCRACQYRYYRFRIR